MKKDRDEQKDHSDYYNVTVSMMVKRTQKDSVKPKAIQIDGKNLAEMLDKGFPYDDADINTLERAAALRNVSVGQIIGQLDGHNITKESLRNLVIDKSVPLTSQLVQINEMKTDADNLSTLFDKNVTRGALKNLVTDRPSPITVKLAQKGDNDNLSTLFDKNVTRGALKNLVTDRPSPITVKLA